MSAQPEVALITGCGSGIGKALAKDLHNRRTETGSPKFIVYATDYRVEGLQELGEVGIHIMQLDVTSSESVNKAVQKVLTDNGRIDLLVCNAGLAGRGFLAEMDYGIVERTFAVNVHGTFRTAQAVAPYMLARRSGKIATLCSVNSYFAQPFTSPYAGSKAAVAIMTESLAMEVNPFGVSVTSVIPGYVKSDILQNSLTETERYQDPRSLYNMYIKELAKFGEKIKDKGISTQAAAKDIADGLAKPTPPRFLYTGTEYRIVLFYAFAQEWISNSFIARGIRASFGLAKPYVPYVAKGEEQSALLQKEE